MSPTETFTAVVKVTKHVTRCGRTCSWGAGEAIGPGGHQSIKKPIRVFRSCVKPFLKDLRLVGSIICCGSCSSDPRLSWKRNVVAIPNDNDVFSSLAECPRVTATVLKLKKSVNGVVVVRPLYILKTSNKSALCRLSSSPPMSIILNVQVCFRRT